MRHALLATLFLGITVLTAAPAEAQEIRSAYRFIDETQSLGAYGGYLFTEPGEPEVGPRSAPIFGLRYNLRFSGPLSGEAALGFIPTSRQVIRSDTVMLEPEPTGATPTMNILVAEVGLRFHLTGPRTWNNLAPFVVASGGLAGDLTGQGTDDEEVLELQRFRFGPSFAVGLGIGTDFFVAERLSLRLEVRDHIFRIPIPAGLREDLRPETQWTNNFAITLGTAIHF